MLGTAATNCGRLIDAGIRPLLVETVAAFGAEADEMSPADFINKLCDETGCGVLLDVTTLTLDVRLGHDPRQWLWDVDPLHIEAIRLRSVHRRAANDNSVPGAFAHLVSNEAWTLAKEIAARTRAETSILELRGECSAIGELQAELWRLASLDRVAAAPSLSELLPAAARATL